jgi:hypothetical protein
LDALPEDPLLEFFLVKAWSTLEYDDGAVLEEEEEYPELLDPELNPPHARPIFSTARLAKPAAGANPLDRLSAGCRD